MTETGTIPTVPLPPLWLMREQSEHIIDRRVRTAQVEGVENVLQTAPRNVQFHLEADASYALLALYPPSERLTVHSRIRRFGQAFPGLFNIDGRARPHVLRPGTKPQPAFFGGIRISDSKTRIAIGENFDATLVSNCFAQLDPDSSLAIARMSIRSSVTAARPFKYKIHFVFAMAFGSAMGPHDFGDRLEDVLVRCFGSEATIALSQPLRGEVAIESRIS